MNNHKLCTTISIFIALNCSLLNSERSDIVTDLCFFVSVIAFCSSKIHILQTKTEIMNNNILQNLFFLHHLILYLLSINY